MSSGLPSSPDPLGSGTGGPDRSGRPETPSAAAKAKTFLLRWAIHSVGVMAASQIVPGIECDTWSGLVIAALVLGLLNAFLRPLLMLVSLPLVLVTFGLFLWVINAGLLYLVGSLVKPFHVASFWSALGGSAVISVISGFLQLALGLRSGSSARIRFERNRRRPPPPRGPGGPGGPVIDV
ncbi:MAG: phage holin family protein [Verrucomicrobiales bacterium]|nr:phage holin family protein [Verrucomicrobiales bacterium]